MKKLGLCILSLGILITGLLLIKGYGDDNDVGGVYQGSRFSEVWDQVRSDPWDVYPQYRVTPALFYKGLKNKILADCQRTIRRGQDILPPWRKLVHPTGICMRGTWNIYADNENNPYTGYFKNGSSGLFITRISMPLSYKKRGNFRGFGLAGKIYPTTDVNHTELLRPANFVTIDRFTGQKISYVTNTSFLNWPKLGYRLFDPVLNWTGSQIIAWFGLADYFPNARQLYEISELGESHPMKAVTPLLMKISGADDQPRIDAEDYRDELNVANYPGNTLRFNIFVSSPGGTLVDPRWKHIGEISLVESVVSRSCDHRLHFHHPIWKPIRTNPENNNEAY